MTLIRFRAQLALEELRRLADDLNHYKGECDRLDVLHWLDVLEEEIGQAPRSRCNGSATDRL